MTDFSQSLPFFDRGYFSYAADMLADYENTPGLPRQFHYQEIDRYPTYSDREQVDINLSPYSYVPQISQRDPITGQYHAMVYDVPFDQVHDDQKNLYLTMFGFLILAAMMVL